MGWKETASFRILVPDDWTVSGGPTKMVLHRDDAEVILSSTSVTGPDQGKEEVLKAVIENAKKALTSTMSHPDLIVRVGLTERDDNPRVRMLKGEAVTKDGTIAFVGSVAVTKNAVMMVTFEGPVGGPAREAFESIMKSIEPR